VTLILGLALYALAFLLVQVLPDQPGGGRRRRSRVAFASLALLFVLFQAPAPSFAQDEAAPAVAEDSSSSVDPSAPADESPIAPWMVYLLIALAAVELAKRVAAAIPGKREDEIISTIELGLRGLVDFLAGKTKPPSESSLVRRE
jgi:hypothetical protein